MTWSTSQANEFVERFWTNERVKCPEHGLPLRVKLLRLLGGDYELHANCPLCGRTGGFRRGDDPHRSRFRPWTASETDELTKRAASGAKPTCPVCTTTIETFPFAENTDRLLIRCLRCGSSNQWQAVFSSTRYGGAGQAKQPEVR